jgi:hypothetical protein
VGWQPSRFLADRAEVERVFAVAERRLAVSTQPRPRWAPAGRRYAKPSPATASACSPATWRQSGSGRVVRGHPRLPWVPAVASLALTGRGR